MTFIKTRWVFLIITFVLSGLLHAQTCPAGLTLISPDGRFTENGDGTILDTQTDLMWMSCSLGETWSGATCTGVATTHSWIAALTLAESTTFAAASDWRLPNINELSSIIETACINSAINETIFPMAITAVYWTSSPNSEFGNKAWAIDFVDSQTSIDNKNSALQVRLVRPTSFVSVSAPARYAGSIYGDSFSNAAIDLAGSIDEMIGADVDFRGVAGHNLTSIRSTMVADAPVAGDSFVILQGGVNSLQGASNDPNVTMQEEMQSMVTHAINNNLDYRVINIGPWKGSVNWTVDRQTYTDSYNTWLLATYPNKHVDMYSVLEDPTNPDKMLASLDNGDGLHPNDRGFRTVDMAIAASLTDSYYSPSAMASPELYDYTNVGTLHANAVTVDLGGTSYSFDGTSAPIGVRQLRSWINLPSVIGQNYRVKLIVDGGDGVMRARESFGGGGIDIASAGFYDSITKELQFLATTTNISILIETREPNTHTIEVSIKKDNSL